MNNKILDVFEYAIETGDIELFDFIAKENLDKLDDEQKASLLERTVILAPNTEILQHILDYDFKLAELNGNVLNYIDDEGNTLLHYAAVSSNPQIVKYLISKGMDLEKKNRVGATPLVLACKETDNVDVIKTLIDEGADTTVTAFNGETLLITAAGCNSNPEVVKFLLKNGFDPEQTDDEGFTAILNAAAWQDNPAVFNELTSVGANIHAKNNKGENLFHIATNNKSFGIAKFIAPSFSTRDVSGEDETCIEKMLVSGRSGKVLKVFLQKQRDEHLLLACFNENEEILETLIQEGYNPNIIDTDGMTVMMFAAKVNTNPNIIAMLKYYRTIWNNRDDSQRNVLHYAASNSDPTIYEWMLEDDDFKTLANERDMKGKLPEYYRENPEEFD